MTNRVAEAEDRHELSYMRQRDWFDPQANPEAAVTLVGVGGIGSPTALALAKLGIPHMTLVDFDQVERHNLPNQMMFSDSTGEWKIEAVKNVITCFSPTNVVTIEGKGEDQKYAGLVISGLDSMQARHDLWHNAIKRKWGVDLYLDGRLAGEHIVIIGVNPNEQADIDFYESECLYSDEEGLEAPCTRQSIIDVGFAVASLMTRAARRHFGGEGYERRIWLDQAGLTITRELP